MNTHYKLFLFLLLMNIASPLYAQHEKDNWYFGLKGGIKFVNGVATPDQNSNLKNYPSSCISDKKTGELLFYTDGKKVWNKNHAIMDGGDSIVAYKSKYYSGVSIITPYPGDKYKYYIFTGLTADKPNRLCYAVVDMNLNNGLGKIISQDNFIYNLSIGYGNIAAVTNTCGNNIWIISGNGCIGADSFYCFRVGLSGVNKNPVITIIPNSQTKKSTLIIKTNKQGDALGIISNASFYGEALAYSFDNLSGVVSNRIKLANNFTKYSPSPTCTEFSPDGSKLYVGYQILGPMRDTIPGSCIMQYSGTSYSNMKPAVNDYKKHVFLDLLRGPDDKIYIGKRNDENRTSTDTIDIIEKPNEPAIACGYKENILNIPGNGFGQRFPLFANTSLPIISTSIEGISTNEICIHDTVKCFISDDTKVDSIFWDFGDTKSTDTSTRLTAEYNYRDTGYKTITARWYACGQQSTITKKIYVYPPPAIDLGADKFFCNKSSITIKPSGNFKGIEWNTGDKSDTLSISKTGTYWVKTGIANCKVFDTIKITELPPIELEIGNDFVICTDDNEEVKLDGGKGFLHYFWMPTGDTTQWISVKQVGDYSLKVEDPYGCIDNDSAKVRRLCDFTFFVPNAFSPNGDGKNDLFGPTCSDISDYYIEIYNRWGEKVFESADPLLMWDGIYKGKLAPDGHYIWEIKFRGVSNKLLRTYNHKGVVTLLR